MKAVRLSKKYVSLLAVAVIFIILLVVHGKYRAAQREYWADWQYNHRFGWQRYDILDGYYKGVRTVVPFSHWEAQNGYNQSHPREGLPKQEPSPKPILKPAVFNPYPDYQSEKYLKQHDHVQECYLDAGEDIPARNVYGYPGLPQHFPQPFYGSYDELGLTNGWCFDRFSRLGPYGLGLNESVSGDLKTLYSQHVDVEETFRQMGHVNFSSVDWHGAQSKCYEKNAARFKEHKDDGKRRIPRHAYVLRVWDQYKYDEHQIYIMRAMINELALKSGGEYDLHLLVHVKNDTIPIWADERVYNKTLEAAVPKEFWNITTLWSVQQMKMYYPGPFEENFARMADSSAHGVYRSAHFALQWFSRQHPEYDFYWNWEMDLRYSGHYYELNRKIGEWAKKQPRKGLWERNRRFYFPGYHGDWQNFTKYVEDETFQVDIDKNNEEKNGPIPIWGPVQNFENSGLLSPPADTSPPTTYDQDNYEWGVGEEADLIVFNPIFDPSPSTWVFRHEVTNYDTSLPEPPRRAAIITASRMSKRLLDTMHEEVWRYKHTMFPEMFAPTVCLHHGLKAVYVPHPVYFRNDWDLPFMNKEFNYPVLPKGSPFGWGEHNLLGSSFYYNSGFAASLWRRWLGEWEDEKEQKVWEERTGRMCLPGILFHPVKYDREDGPRN